jgi:hypothetical protein
MACTATATEVFNEQNISIKVRILLQFFRIIRREGERYKGI